MHALHVSLQRFANLARQNENPSAIPDGAPRACDATAECLRCNCMANSAGDTSLRPNELVTLLPIALGLLAAEGNEYASLKQDLRRWAKDDPIDALVATVLGGGLAFYLAERDGNPNCTTPWDGILYIA